MNVRQSISMIYALYLQGLEDVVFPQSRRQLLSAVQPDPVKADIQLQQGSVFLQDLHHGVGAGFVQTRHLKFELLQTDVFLQGGETALL